MLDPLFTLSAQNQRLTENTQRSSDAVRTQALKEGKEKGRRGAVDSAEISSDLNQMGDDLLGSMDPDLFGKSGSASLFKRLWEETVEGEEEEDEDQDQEGGGGHRDHGAPLPDFGEAPPPEESAAPEQTPAPAGDRLEPPPSLEPPARPRADESAALPEKSPAPEARPGSREVLEFSRPEVRRRPSVETGEPVPSKPASTEPAAQAGGSLLDLSEGFLLHEATVEFESTDEVAPDPDAEPLPVEVENVLAALLQGDSHSAAWPRLQRVLGRFGAGVLRLCAQQKVRVCLLPKGSGVRAHPAVRNALGSGRASGGAYLPESRTCLVEEEALLQVPWGFQPALFYFALAWDHALGGEDFASVQSAAVKASFDACRRGLPGHAFSDGMAAESPVHYFAQGVEAYLSENDSQEPLWTREDLYDFDRSMYSYVEYLLKQGNRSA